MNVDVVIVGGGPAGCSAALTLCSLGYSTAVVDAFSSRNKPTETAMPVLAHLLRALGAAEALKACEPCFGICSSWGRKTPAVRPSILDPFGHAWFVHRGPFDNYLQECVRTAGVVWVEARGLDVDFETQRVSITTTSQRICAKWIVLATGSPLMAARVTSQRTENIDSLVALWAHLPLHLKPRFLYVEPAPCGWWYLCPRNSDETTACLVTDAPSARQLGAAQITKWNLLYGQTNLSRQFRGDFSGTVVEAASSSISILPKKHGVRWIAVGDAAMKLDPLGSAGLTTAIDSGRRAARAVADSLNGNPASADQYGRWTTRLVGEFVRQRAQHYAIEGAGNVAAFWTRRLRHAA